MTPSPNHPPEDTALENAIEEICRFAAKLKHAKENDEQIQKRLTDAGLSSEAARAVTRTGLAHVGKDQRAGRRNLVLGAVCFFGGLIVTAAGGRSLIVYGVILIGLFLMLFGLTRTRQVQGGAAEIRDIVERVRPAVSAEESSRWKIAAIRIHNP
jgi:hypothetical protein